jgi:hypothetical protein
MARKKAVEVTEEPEAISTEEELPETLAVEETPKEEAAEAPSKETMWDRHAARMAEDEEYAAQFKEE